MKKLFTAIMAGFMMSTMAACAAKEQTTEQSVEAPQGEVVSIGIMQIAEHPSLDEIRTSIEEELKASADFKFEIDYQNAQNDFTNLNSIAQKFVGDQKDLIIAIATPTAQAAMAATDEIPIVFSAVSDPVAAGVEGKNITGTSDAIPVEKIFSLMSQLTPEAKSVGFVYNTGEANSVSVIEKAKEYAKNNSFTVIESTITNSSELAQATQNLVGKVDAIFTPIDNTVAEAMPVLADIAMENKIPVYTGADSLVKDGGFATVGINYTVLGKETAKIVTQVVNGESPSAIPYKVMENFDVVINQTTADAIGVVLPEEVKKDAIIVE